MRKFLPYIIIILLAIGGYLLFKSWYKRGADIERLQKNIVAERQTSLYFKTKNGQMAASRNIQQFTVDEIKQEIAGAVLAELKNLDIKPKNLINYSETVIKQEHDIKTTIRDSIIYDTVKVEYFDYSDSWIDFYGIINNDSINVSVKTTDSIIQVVSKERTRPWLWIFSPTKLKQTVTSKNPYSTILYNKYIEVK